AQGEGRLVLADEARRVGDVENREQQQRDDEPEDVEQREDAPRELRVDRNGVAGRLPGIDLECFDGGHVARILTDAPAASAGNPAFFERNRRFLGWMRAGPRLYLGL